MIHQIFFSILNVRSDRSTEDRLDSIDAMLLTNKVEEATKAFKDMESCKGKNIYYDIKYAEFLFQLGSYKELIDTYKNKDEEKFKNLVKNATKYNNPTYHRSIDGLKELLSCSKYYKAVYVELIDKLLKSKKISDANIYSNKFKAFYKSDIEATEWYGISKLFTYNYSSGVKILKEINKYKTECKHFDIFINRYTKWNSSANKGQQVNVLDNLYTDILKRQTIHKYTPSIYSYFKYNVVLAAYIENSVANRSKTIVDLSLELMNYNMSDKNKYHYLMALCINKDKRVEQKFMEMNIKTAKYVDKLREEINNLKEGEKKEKPKAKQVSGGKNDRKGYYKMLGVPHTATIKEIKKAFVDRSKENNYAKFKGKDEEEYVKRHEQQKELNRAKDILTNKTSRSSYDSGMDETMTGGRRRQGQQQVVDIGDIFGAMFGGGRSIPFNFGNGGARQQSQPAGYGYDTRSYYHYL